jgi:RNA polymerase sigma-70 factor (sigma-E family)
VDEDLDEFTSFVTSSSAALFRLAALLTGGDAHAAQDLVQDAFSDTYLRWHRIKEGGARVAYTRRILVRAASRRWRRAAADRHHLAALPRIDYVPGHADQVDTQQDLWAALGDLSARQRAVVVLRYYEGLTEAQTAEVLGCSVGAVKSHASRALRSMRERLGGTAYVIEEVEGTP